MDTISSAEFRRTYPRLTKSVVVTVNGHGIGVWSPVRDVPAGTITPFASEPHTPERYKEVGDRALGVPMTQAERDAILRRVNKGG